jgi:tetratricopeptide (TPR) repeat protein
MQDRHKDRFLPVAAGNLAAILNETGRIHESRRYHELAMRLVRERGLGSIAADLQYNYSLMLRREGELEESAEHLEAAIEACAEVGHVRALSQMLCARATLLLEQGLERRAEEAGREAVAHARRHRSTVGNALGNLGYILSRAGKLAEAETTLQQACEACREEGNRRQLGVATGNLAKLLAETGREAEAETVFRQAFEIHREVNNHASAVLHRVDLAMLLLRQGRRRDAELIWEEAQPLRAQAEPDRYIDLRMARMREACEELGEPPFE